jgi:hypothetical protein
VRKRDSFDSFPAALTRRDGRCVKPKFVLLVAVVALRRAGSSSHRGGCSVAERGRGCAALDRSPSLRAGGCPVITQTAWFGTSIGELFEVDPVVLSLQEWVDVLPLVADQERYKRVEAKIKKRQHKLSAV